MLGIFVRSEVLSTKTNKFEIFLTLKDIRANNVSGPFNNFNGPKITGISISILIVQIFCFEEKTKKIKSTR